MPHATFRVRHLHISVSQCVFCSHPLYLRIAITLSKMFTEFMPFINLWNKNLVIAAWKKYRKFLIIITISTAKKVNINQYNVSKMPRGYSDLVWTGVCHLSLKTHTHFYRSFWQKKKHQFLGIFSKIEAHFFWEILEKQSHASHFCWNWDPCLGISCEKATH